MTGERLKKMKNNEIKRESKNNDLFSLLENKCHFCLEKIKPYFLKIGHFISKHFVSISSKRTANYSRMTFSYNKTGLKYHYTNKKQNLKPALKKQHIKKKDNNNDIDEFNQYMKKVR